MAAAPRDFSPSPTYESVTNPVCTKGWAKDVKNVSSDKIAVDEMIAGKSVAQLFVDTGSARLQAARKGPLMISKPLKASTRCVGLSSGSIPTSNPKRICQIMSPTPATRNKGTPSSDNS